MNFDIDTKSSTTNYFYNYCFTVGDVCTYPSHLYDRTEYETQAGDDIIKQYVHESSSLYRLDYINLVKNTTNLVKQDFAYSGDTTRIYEISYDILDNGSTEYKYRYLYDDIGNITTVYYYEGTILMTYEEYEYDELNQLIIENHKDDSVTCPTVTDTCYTKYYYYDDQGNITHVKTFLYGEVDTIDIVVPTPDPSVSTGAIDVFEVVSGDKTLNVGQTLSLSFSYYIDDGTFPAPQVTAPISTSCNYGDIDVNTEDYYILECTGSFKTIYNISFEVLITVGTPPTTVLREPEEHIYYSYDSGWEDQLTDYGTIDYINGVPQTEVASQEFTYDNQGNPISITEFYYNGVHYHHANLEYDGRQLTKIKVFDDLIESIEIVTISYNYNDSGYRTSKTIDDGTPETIIYTLNRDKVIYETNGTYGIINTYDVNGKIISFNYDVNVNDQTAGIEYFYIRNQQGDITKIIDKDGNLEVEYVYDAWGNILDVGRYSGQENVEDANHYTYRGYRYDDEIKMYYLNSRFYNPTIGRFLNVDGLLGEQGSILGHNLYSYTQNNPVMYVDPSGYRPIRGISDNDYFDYGVLFYNHLEYSSESKRNEIIISYIEDEYEHCVKMCDLEREPRYSFVEFVGLSAGLGSGILLTYSKPKSFYAFLSIGGIGLAAGGSFGGMIYGVGTMVRSFNHSSCLRYAEEKRDQNYEFYGVIR